MLRTIALLLLLAGVIAITTGYVRATAAAKCPPPQVVFRYLPPMPFPQPMPMGTPDLVPSGTLSLPGNQPVPVPIVPQPGMPVSPVMPMPPTPFIGASGMMDALKNDGTVLQQVFYDAQQVGGGQRVGG